MQKLQHPSRPAVGRVVVFFILNFLISNAQIWNLSQQNYYAFESSLRIHIQHPSPYIRTCETSNCSKDAREFKDRGVILS